MGIAAGIGMYAFLSLLSVVDGVAFVVSLLAWLVSFLRTEEGSSWYWFYWILLTFILGIILGLAMVASIAYTAASAVTTAASSIQAQQANKEDE